MKRKTKVLVCDPIDTVAKRYLPPHTGAQTIEAQRAASDLIAEKIINVFK